LLELGISWCPSHQAEIDSSYHGKGKHMYTQEKEVEESIEDIFTSTQHLFDAGASQLPKRAWSQRMCFNT
jgi:hypothetical protein